MNDLAPGWEIASLGDVCEVIRGITFPATAKERAKTNVNVCCLRTTNIQREVDWRDVYFVSQEFVKRGNQLVQVGDIIMSMANSYDLVGKVAIARSVPFETAFGAFLSAVRTRGMLLGPYLFHFLRTDHTQQLLRQGSSQTTNIANISVRTLSAISVPIAPLSEQKRITDKLDALLTRVDACRERLDRVPAILKRFRQSVLTAATSGELTREWRDAHFMPENTAETELEEGMDQRRVRHKGKRAFKEPSQPDMTYWRTDVPPAWAITSVSVFSDCLDHLRVPVTRDKRSKSHGSYPYYGANGLVDMVDEFIFDDELVLVTEDETFYGREKPIAYRTSGRCWVNNHAHVLAPGSRLRADYLCLALMHYDVLPWLTGTTGRAKLTQAVLNALPIAVPPTAEMVEVVRRVEYLFALAASLEKDCITARAYVERLPSSVLARAFRGDLVPQDPNDEPASALLARLRGQADASAKPTKANRIAKIKKQSLRHGREACEADTFRASEER